MKMTKLMIQTIDKNLGIQGWQNWIDNEEVCCFSFDLIQVKEPLKQKAVAHGQIE